MTFYARTPSVPLLRAGSAEAQLANAGSTGELRRAKAREDVFAVCTRVADKGAKWGIVGAAIEGAQHVGTGMGLGGMKGRSMRGNNRKLAARIRVAVVKVMANATENRSCRAVCGCGCVEVEHRE